MGDYKLPKCISTIPNAGGGDCMYHAIAVSLGTSTELVRCVMADGLENLMEYKGMKWKDFKAFIPEADQPYITHLEKQYDNDDEFIQDEFVDTLRLSGKLWGDDLYITSFLISPALCVVIPRVDIGVVIMDCANQLQDTDYARIFTLSMPDKHDNRMWMILVRTQVGRSEHYELGFFNDVETEDEYPRPYLYTEYELMEFLRASEYGKFLTIEK